MVSGDKGWGSDNPSVILYLWGMLRDNSCGNILAVKTISKHGMSAGSVSFSGTAWKSFVIYNLCCWVRGPQMSGGCTCSNVMALCTDDADMPICYANHLFPWWCLQYSTNFVSCVLNRCLLCFVCLYVCATCYLEQVHVIVHFLQEALKETYIHVTTCLWHCGCSWLTRWAIFDVIEANRKWQNDMGQINHGPYTCAKWEIFI